MKVSLAAQELGSVLHSHSQVVGLKSKSPLVSHSSWSRLQTQAQLGENTDSPGQSAWVIPHSQRHTSGELLGTKLVGHPILSILHTHRQSSFIMKFSLSHTRSGQTHSQVSGS